MVTIDGDEIAVGSTIDGDEIQEITMDGDVVWEAMQPGEFEITLHEWDSSTQSITNTVNTYTFNDTTFDSGRLAHYVANGGEVSEVDELVLDDGTVIEDWERSNPEDDWNEVSNINITTTSDAIGPNTTAGRIEDTAGTGSSAWAYSDFQGPSRGQNFSVLFRAVSSPQNQIGWCAGTESFENGYFAAPIGRFDSFLVEKYEDGDSTTLAQEDMDVPDGSEWKIDVKWA